MITDMQEPTWSVAIFAHNEESRILACLRSILEASAGRSMHTYVLANGCHDRTEAIVRTFALTHPSITLVSLELGDKAGAWNHFVHEIAPDGKVCFFVDGDVRVERGSLRALSDALQTAPEANAAAAVPAAGRSREFLQQLVCDRHLLLGNLYAVQGDFVRRARAAGARLPVGYIGDDGLVTSLAKWNLDPTGPFVDALVLPCPAARFSYTGFSIWRAGDWRRYWRRLVRYSLRHYQHQLLKPLLIEGGLVAMPATVTELYQRQAGALRHCRPRLGPTLLFDMIAIAQMRRREREPTRSKRT